MSWDEEIKDARYFPSQEETNILTKAMDQYFKYPERSDNRSRIVQEVTVQLSSKNPHWSHRYVRLWFNNNKKTNKTKSSNPDLMVQFSPEPTGTTTTSSLPPKKRKIPPRPASVNTTFSSITNCTTSITDNQQQETMSSLDKLKQQKNTTDVQKSSETEWTEKLIDINKKKWNEEIEPIEQWSVINSPDEIPRNNPPTEVISWLPNYETGFLMDNGSAVTVEFNPDRGTRIFRTKDWSNELTGIKPFRASSAIYDPTNNRYFTAIGSNVYKISGPNPDDIISLSGDEAIMVRAPMTVLPSMLMLGSRKTVSIWSFDNLKVKPTIQFKTGLPTISSITTMGIAMKPIIITSSSNHHAIHIYTEQGNQVSSFLGHGGGVTCLHPIDESSFLSGSTDLTVRLWDLRTELPMAQLQKHYEPLSMVGTALNDNKIVITGGEDHYVRIWDLRISKMLYAVNVGAGVPTSASFDLIKKKLYVLTESKRATTAQGFSTSQPVDLTSHGCSTSPNAHIMIMFEK